MARRVQIKPATKSSTALPDLATATKELTLREARAVVWMFVRLVCVGALLALLLLAVPALKPFRPVFDAIAGVLVLAPMFTSLGRVFAWRIALGKAYTEANRFEDAEQILSPISGIRARLFDVAGEGRLHRALSLASRKQPDEARALFTEVAETGREPWKTRAAQELMRLGAGTQNGGAAPAATSS